MAGSIAGSTMPEALAVEAGIGRGGSGHEAKDPAALRLLTEFAIPPT
jgi:hypothetical protein